MKNEDKILKLLDLLDKHDCTMYDKGECVCEEIYKQLEELGINVSAFWEYEV